MKHLAILMVAAYSLALHADVSAGQGSDLAAAGTVNAELTKKIDTKNAAVGDQVSARTTAETTLSDGTKLPKGTQMVGHVTAVHAKSNDDPRARLAFSLDRAVLRDGREVPVRAVLIGAAAPRGPVAESDDDIVVRAGRGARGGGGGGGGLVSGTAKAVDGTVSSPGSVAGNTVAIPATGVGEVAQAGTSIVHPVSGAAVANLPGVTVTSSVGASESGWLDARGKNISLDSGTQMTFYLSAGVR